MKNDTEIVDRNFKDGVMDDYLTMPDEGTDEEDLPHVENAQYLGTGYLYTAGDQTLTIVEQNQK